MVRPTGQSDDRRMGTDSRCGQGGPIHGAEFPRPLLSSHAQALLVSLLGRDRVTAKAVVSNALQLAGREAVYRDVVARAMADVGMLWERRELTSDDHAAAVALIEETIASVALDPLTNHDRDDAEYALVTVAAAETHLIGARVVADCLRARGWAVTDLGPTSPGALAGLCAALAPRLVVIAGAVIGHRSAVRRAVEEVSTLEERPRILVGGQMTCGSTRGEFGADAVTSVLEDGLDWADRIR